MFKLFDKRMTLEQSEQLMLISEAVKSGLSLSEAIGLTVTGNSREDRAFSRFAKMLDQGEAPETAVSKSGFPAAVRDAFGIALRDGDFCGAFALQSQLVNSRRQFFLQLLNALAYPLWLILSALTIFFVFMIFVVPSGELLLPDQGIKIPFATLGLFHLSSIIIQGWFWLILLVFALLLYITVRFFIPRFVYMSPFFGAPYLRLFQVSLLRTIAFSLRRGIPFEEILLSCRSVTTNRSLQKELLDAARASGQGRSIFELFTGHPWLFPIWLAPFWSACKDPAEQAQTLERAASLLESQNQRSVTLLQSLALTGALLFVVLLVVTIVVCVFMPVFNVIIVLGL